MAITQRQRKIGRPSHPCQNHPDRHDGVQEGLDELRLRAAKTVEQFAGQTEAHKLAQDLAHLRDALEQRTETIESYAPAVFPFRQYQIEEGHQGVVST